MGLIFIPLVLVSIVLLINVVLFLVARFGGWQEMEKIYPERKVFQGKEWRFRCLRFTAWAGYNNIVTIGANAEGIRLAMPWFFSTGHSPIFIPWSEVTGRTDTTLFYMPLSEISVRGTDRKISFPRRLVDELFQERAAD